MGPDYLIQEMRVTNTGTEDFTFTAALHTYYRVKNIDKVYIVKPAKALQGSVIC